MSRSRGAMDRSRRPVGARRIGRRPMEIVSRRGGDGFECLHAGRPGSSPRSSQERARPTVTRSQRNRRPIQKPRVAETEQGRAWQGERARVASWKPPDDARHRHATPPPVKGSADSEAVSWTAFLRRAGAHHAMGGGRLPRHRGGEAARRRGGESARRRRQPPLHLASLITSPWRGPPRSAARGSHRADRRPAPCSKPARRAEAGCTP